METLKHSRMREETRIHPYPVSRTLLTFDLRGNVCRVCGCSIRDSLCCSPGDNSSQRGITQDISVQELVTRKQDKKRLSRHLLASYSLQTVGEKEGFDKRDGHLMILYDVIG